jgi:hypothetical protein
MWASISLSKQGQHPQAYLLCELNDLSKPSGGCNLNWSPATRWPVKHLESGTWCGLMLLDDTHVHSPLALAAHQVNWLLRTVLKCSTVLRSFVGANTPNQEKNIMRISENHESEKNRKTMINHDMSSNCQEILRFLQGFYFAPCCSICQRRSWNSPWLQLALYVPPGHRQNIVRFIGLSGRRPTFVWQMTFEKIVWYVFSINIYICIYVYIYLICLCVCLSYFLGIPYKYMYL